MEAYEDIESPIVDDSLQDFSVQSHSFVQVDGKQCQTDLNCTIPGQLVDRLTNHKVELSFQDTEFITKYSGDPVSVKLAAEDAIPVSATVASVPDIVVKQNESFTLNPVLLKMDSGSKVSFGFDDDTKGEFTTLKNSLTNAINQLTIFKESFEFKESESANASAVAVLALKNALNELNASCEKIQTIGNNINLDTARFSDVLTGVDRLLQSIDTMARTTTQRLSDQFSDYNSQLSGVMDRTNDLVIRCENILAKADNLYFAMNRMNQLIVESNDAHLGYVESYSDHQIKLIDVIQECTRNKINMQCEISAQFIKVVKILIYALIGFMSIKILFKVVGI